MFFFTSSIFIFFGVLLTIQAALDISFFNIDVPYYNPKYLKDVDFYLMDDNKLYGNLTIIEYFPNNTMFHLAIIGATMGEYIVPTGFDIEFPMCEIFKDPILTGPVLNKMGFDQNKCPPERGTYVTEDFESDFSLYPEEFPPNNYVVKSELYTQEERIFELHSYERIV